MASGAGVDDVGKVNDPKICDLSGDPLCRAILGAWARQPWDLAHATALIDRAQDLGYDVTWESFGGLVRAEVFRQSWAIARNRLPRRRFRFNLKMWWDELRRSFGPFE